MFRSIFSKYLAIFTAILVCCIVAILLAISSRITNDAYAVRRDAMSAAAGSSSVMIENYVELYSYHSLINAFGDGMVMDDVLEGVSEHSRIHLYVFDEAGDLLGTSDNELKQRNIRISQSAVNVMISTKDSYAVSTVDGFFETTHLNEYHVANSREGKIIVLASMENYGRAVFTTEMFIVSTTVSLWVFLAAMLSLYAVSRRTTKPLSQIVNAAKSYAKGRFDQRIEVVGQDEVADLATAINDMAESLKHLDEERNSFLGNVSHDLRTPMTTIAGFVDGILDGTIPPEKHQYYLNIISQEVRRLSRLVNTLLEVSRMESGADLKYTDFNLSEIARRVIISLESKISKKNIDIEFDTGDKDIYVHADEDSIHRVIFNLTDNAVKFTPEKGKITINLSTVSDGRKNNRKARFVIRNTGQGIPKEELSHVFDRFYKTDRSRGLDKSGTGLGLYIAKNAILNHGEDLTVDSVVGEHTEFRFTLPLSLVEVLPREYKGD